jgi:hypothetical protein
MFPSPLRGMCIHPSEGDLSCRWRGGKAGFSVNYSFKTPSYGGAMDREHHPALGVKWDMVKLQVLVIIDMLENRKVQELVHEIVNGNDNNNSTTVQVRYAILCAI